MIELNQVEFAYQTAEPLLAGIDLKVTAGEFILLTGPSGGGKTTLTRIINGLIPYFFGGVRKGEVKVAGQEISELNSWELASQVGSVFQDPRSQFFAPIVKDELAFFCENYGLPTDKIRQQVQQASHELGIQHLLEKQVIQLSSGEKQKVAIASIRVADQQIYLLDEPSANLDSQATQELKQILTKWKAAGHTIVIAEHRLYYLNELIDRSIYLRDGVIEKIFTKDQWANVSSQELIEYGLRSPELMWQSVSTITEKRNQKPNFVIENVTVGFGKRQPAVLNNLDFTLQAGEIAAIIGKNGAGKSTLAKTLTGLLKEKSGTFSYLGKSIPVKKRSKVAWYVMQEADLQLFSASVLEELLVGQKKTSEKLAQAEELLKELGLWKYRKRHPASLSGGQKQRLTIGVALMQETPLIILDEPTAGLDGANLIKMVQVIKKAAGKGTTFLIISHDFELLNYAVERILYFSEGLLMKDYLLNEGTSSQVLANMLGENNR
ncbi:ABC transporter ATP-binding protein [Carnobacterium gallinarum]|uniref:ABC transporter ATP-binding protein n=1 Tax=Carnobacterium gallinarum TaxID=2749 RepID=UPI000556CD41|nr:energy-coupling factor ABC transporter ATP-binding protein [Carnobacterium gallinarum]